ncbi:AAA domain-containing protein [Streptomyces sp. DvalAA-14]|uniref:AAA family ATPase n=1 Tax=unclassified Streptomyces TaxID=2593676 RepID=UPI00081BB538|nr:MULTISPECIES: AAA family ATPase [unclassified Streptomyces]MYS19170.1 AAA family ATPase [Streptomyces sp. SID4948]SCD38279.1 AAA domain-containing protein [Streptomyces sp. DvalAA-14]
MRTVDPLQLPTSFTITEARTADLGEHPRLLDGLLYVGLSVVFSAPGLGKSMLQAAVEEHLAFGRPFGHWMPEGPHRCMVVDLEGDMRLAAERSLTLTPWGLLPSDHGRPMPADIDYETEWPGHELAEKLARLDQRLTEAEQEGRPYSYVRIDTLRLFLGSKPHGVNAYEWDAWCLRQVNRLALQHGVCIVAVHHTNKAGELSGSTGIAGSAVAVMKLTPNPDNPDECLLVSEKVRVDAPFRYALEMDDKGRWSFTDAITPTQAQLTGTKRAVVDVLTSRGPRDAADLRAALPTINPNTLKAALRRLSREGITAYRRGRWELSQLTIADHPKCRLCDQPMTVVERGQDTHPQCVPDPGVEELARTWLGTPTVEIPAQPGPAIEEPEHQEEDQEEEHDHPETRRFPAFAEMKRGFEQRSRMHPLPRVVKAEREGKPWTLMSERMDGAHQSKGWTGPVPADDALIAVIDRNGSFPSACSSVPVAPNALTHTGALGVDVAERRQRGGIFQVVIPEWREEGTPHPLGRVGAVGETVWITSSAIEHMDKLAAAGRVKLLDVLDSWTGRRNASLFEPFYRWAKQLREATASEPQEVRDEAKRAISTAIRGLWPKQARSPFWRPDWNISIRAEASIRHWDRADKAVAGGAWLLSLGNTDEAVFVMPAGETDRLWVPEPYRIGPGFGQVKHKPIKLRTGEEVMSPMPYAQFKLRGVPRRERQR